MSWVEWTDADAAARIRVPTASDDKYSRGVLGVLTGSRTFPGAAVLGVEAAVRTGVGMVRFLGAEKAADAVVHRRPEVVTAQGRVQAWLIGSGFDEGARADAAALVAEALESGLPVILDAGALADVSAARVPGRVVVTPHAGELARLLSSRGHDATPDAVMSSPESWALRAAEELHVTVLLKGNTTRVVSPEGSRVTVSGSTPWLATAGSGDVLAGILGALLATSIDGDSQIVAQAAASAALLHDRAARLASGGGPIAALDIADAVPAAVRDVLGSTHMMNG
ncbi:ADP-dependent NAD(P)H-hydrate dehydratase [Paramicrobacterium chengjingii]|uniref:ADP-dependent (S)-NAD(P)H-hydrate dehydratase n=1 Tax=Paramicrobacterium chengjingii TaxID=2769067 RepID=A0ABX6YET2_9MICO|nr:ADP/ATP-dependent (S)-NAD(P)H-hydrate dehydratase [Microbacterium chengjingii]QPZ37283.1 NAD(P)H-hydrate dehydratase [Microbacterium chengjingii]